MHLSGGHCGLSDAGADAAADNSRLCELTVESRTGKVVSARLCLINAGPVGAAGAKADMLRAYCEYLGLDMLEDWVQRQQLW